MTHYSIIIIKQHRQGYRKILKDGLNYINHAWRNFHSKNYFFLFQMLPIHIQGKSLNGLAETNKYKYLEW